MNQQKLTHLETNKRRFQILLLVFVTLFLAVPVVAQVTDSISPCDDSQAQVQRKTLPATDFNCLRFVEQEAPLTRSAPAEATAGSPQPSSPSSKFAVFGGVGVAVPHGDFSTFLDPGLSVNAGLEYMITPQFSAEGFLGYHRFSNFFIGHTSLYQVSGNAKFYLVDESSKVRPFVNGGVGDYVTNSGTSHFGGNVGAGILLEVTPRFGVQGAYNFNIFSASTNFKFSTVQGGVRFRF